MRLAILDAAATKEEIRNPEFEIRTRPVAATKQEIRNPKFEILNKFEIQNIKTSAAGTSTLMAVSSFSPLAWNLFGMVCFGCRVSDAEYGICGHGWKGVNRVVPWTSSQWYPSGKALANSS